MPEIAQARVFSKCDVKSWFWHIQLDEQSSKMTALITPFGRYRWLKMPFGITSAPEVFQKALQQALVGLCSIFNIHDDIIVGGEGNSLRKAEESHAQRMQEMLTLCRKEHCIKQRQTQIHR